MPDRLLTRSKESLLQLEMSEVTEGSVMDVSAQMEVETTGQPLMTSTPHKKRKKRKKKKGAECGKSYVQKKNLVRQRKQNTTNWMMDSDSLVHNVIRNLPCLMIFILI